MVKEQTKRGRGRPPKHEDAMFGRVNIRVPQQMLDKIGAIAVGRADRPDVAQVVRELLAKALE